MQEVVALVVFAGLSLAAPKEPLTLNHAVGFSFVSPGARLVFRGPFA